MSQVKFIQLGTITEPKKNYVVDGNNEYTTDLQSAINSYPGAVIFTTFIKSATGKPKNEIYANGQLYSAGGSGSGAVYYGTVDVGADGQIENFSSTHEGAEPEVGNVYIYDPTDDAEKTSGGNIADCTAYYYDSSKWVAFTGNVNAENVWFPNGVDRTEAWGTKAKDSSGKIQNECVDMNLREVLDYYLVKEMDPELVSGYHNDTYPTWSISLANSFPTKLTLKRGTSSTGAEVTSGSLVKVGDKFYLSEQSFIPSLNCGEAGNNYTQTYGPAYISGLEYGYWNVESEVGDKTKLKKDALTDIGHVGHIHGNSTTGTISYNLNQTNGNNTLTVTTTNFIDSNSTTSDTKTGSNELTVGERTLTAQKGVNKVKLELSVGNTWRRTAQSVTIPGINTVYACTNKGNVSYTNATEKIKRTASVAAKSISDTADTKSISDKNTSEFKVYAVYPIFTNGVEKDNTAKDKGEFSSNPHNQINLSTTYQINNSDGINTSTFYIGFGQPDTKDWLVYIPSIYKLDTCQQYNPLTQGFNAGVTFTQVETSPITIEGYNNLYYTYKMHNPDAGPNVVKFTLKPRS